MVENSGANLQHQRLKKWLAQKYCPNAAVYSSPVARELLKQQAYMSPAELLRPFSDMSAVNLRTCSTHERSQPYKLNKFRLNAIDAHKMDPIPQKDNNLIFDYIIQTQAPQINQQKQIATGEAPWFNQWKRHFHDSTQFSDTDLTQQPVMFIYFVSASEREPLHAIDQLKRQMPRIYREAIFSQEDILQNVFILATNHDKNNAETVASLIRNKFQQHQVHVVPMTGDLSKQSQQPSLPDIWKPYADPFYQILEPDFNPLSLEQRGQAITENDRELIKKLMIKLIETQFIPYFENKIRGLEFNITKTSKGIKNQFKNFWKKPDRGENEGAKENFRLNKQENEIRNLVDLALISQDYDTVVQNSKLPISDLKSCKAYVHSAAFLEVYLLGSLASDPSFSQNMKEIDNIMDQIHSLNQKSEKTMNLIKSGMLMADLLRQLNQFEKAARILIRISDLITGQSVVSPLFLEQAAYFYFKAKKMRKFAFYMIQAGKQFDRIGLKQYSFYCFSKVHPYYSGLKWNGIRFFLFSTLGKDSQNLGDIQMAVKYFRNLLELCCELGEKQGQSECLNEFLLAVQNWNDQNIKTNLLGMDGKDQKARIGQLPLPEVLPDSIEVFSSTEKIYTNTQDELIDGSFLALPASVVQDSTDSWQIQQKSELNSGNVPWKFLGKTLFEHIAEERKKEGVEIQAQMAQFGMEENNEFQVFDAGSRQRKREIVQRKPRTCFQGQPITVKFTMKNPLKVDINITHIKLICYFEDSDKENEDCYFFEKALELKELEQKEVITQIIPMKTGKLTIRAIEWNLFDLVYCHFNLLNPKQGQNPASQVEEERKFNQLHPLLKDKKNQFIFQVSDESGDLEIKPELQKQNQHFTEYTNCKLKLKNLSLNFPLKNGYMICSHPLLFGIEKLKIFDKLDPEETKEIDLSLRACLFGPNEIKFLFRFEVDTSEEEEKVSDCARFRVARAIINMKTDFSFLVVPQVSLSSQNAKEHIIIVQIVDKMATGESYEPPHIKGIQILNYNKKWTLSKKDQRGNLFVIHPAESTEVNSILQYEPYLETPEMQNVLEDPELKTFLEAEHQFLKHKFKLKSTQEDEEVDIVLYWEMPRLKKRGFYSLFKVRLLQTHSKMTEKDQERERERKKVLEASLDVDDYY